MNGGADVVGEAGKGELGGPAAAADGVRRLEDDDLAAGSCNLDGRSQAVGAGAYDDRIGLTQGIGPTIRALPPKRAGAAMTGTSGLTGTSGSTSGAWFPGGR